MSSEKIPKHNPLIQSFGGMAFNASNLEAILISLCSSLVNKTDIDIQNILKSTLNVSISVKIIKTILSEKLNDDDSKDIFSTINEIEEALNQRNSILHSTYYQNSSVPDSPITRLKIRAKGKNGLHVTEEILDIENVSKISTNIERLLISLGDIGLRLIELNLINREFYYGDESE